MSHVSDQASDQARTWDHNAPRHRRCLTHFCQLDQHGDCPLSDETCEKETP